MGNRGLPRLVETRQISTTGHAGQTTCHELHLSIIFLWYLYSHEVEYYNLAVIVILPLILNILNLQKLSVFANTGIFPLTLHAPFNIHVRLSLKAP